MVRARFCLAAENDSVTMTEMYHNLVRMAREISKFSSPMMGNSYQFTIDKCEVGA